MSWLTNKPPKFRAVPSPYTNTVWWLEERRWYGWVHRDSICGRDQAQTRLNRLAKDEVLYPETQDNAQKAND